MSSNGTRRSWGSGSLMSETQRTGRVVWIGQVRVNGKQRQRTLGPKSGKGALTKRQAEAALRAFRDEVEAQAEADADASERHKATLREACEAYLHHLDVRRGLRRATLTDYEMYVRRHLCGPVPRRTRGSRPHAHPPFFGDALLDEVTPERVDSYVDEKREQGVAVSTLHNHLNFLAAVFEHARARGQCEHNPVKAIERPRERAKIEEDLEYLDLEEIEAVLRACEDDDRGTVDRALFAVAFMTGLRRGELVALRWQDIDFEGKSNADGKPMVKVRRTYSRGEFGPPKSEKSRRDVPLTRRVLQTLALHQQWSEYATEDDLVFCHPHTGKPYDPDTLSARFKDACRRADVRVLNFHKARHSFASRLASAGVPLLGLSKMLGHSDIKTTQIYAHFYADGHDLIERAFAPTHANLTDDPSSSLVA